MLCAPQVVFRWPWVNSVAGWRTLWNFRNFWPPRWPLGDCSVPVHQAGHPPETYLGTLAGSVPGHGGKVTCWQQGQHLALICQWDSQVLSLCLSRQQFRSLCEQVSVSCSLGASLQSLWLDRDLPGQLCFQAYILLQHNIWKLHFYSLLRKCGCVF